jgi:glutaredoxin-like protein DUF836
MKIGIPRPLLQRRALREPLVLYSKADCSLCERAEQLARRAVRARGVRVVEISGQRELEDAYVFRVPVLCYRNVVLAEGLIEERDMRRALGIARQLDRDRSPMAG